MKRKNFFFYTSPCSIKQFQCLVRYNLFPGTKKTWGWRLHARKVHFCRIFWGRSCHIALFLGSSIALSYFFCFPFGCMILVWKLFRLWIYIYFMFLIITEVHYMLLGAVHVFFLWFAIATSGQFFCSIFGIQFYIDGGLAWQDV